MNFHQIESEVANGCVFVNVFNCLLTEKLQTFSIVGI